MRIVASRILPGPELRAIMELALTDRIALAAMPERQRCVQWRDNLDCRFARRGDAVPYVAFDADAATPLALYWVDLCGAGVGCVHQFVLPKARRGMTAVLAARACARACLDDFPSIDFLMGITPEVNRAALAVARRVGFEDRGRVNGCSRLLVAEREVFYGVKWRN